MATVKRGSTATGKLVWGAAQPITLVPLNEKPPPEPPPMARPKVTITSYEPKIGEAPLRCRAVWAKETGSGPVTRVHWLIRPLGSTLWTLAADNPATDDDHTYQVGEGQFEIALKAIGPGGIGQTGKQRIITATAPDIEQPPPEPPPSDVPVYASFVTQECPKVAQTFQATTGVQPGASNFGHNSYRRLAQGWTAAEVQAGIVNPDLNFNRAPWFGWVPVDYDTFVQDESNEVAAAYGAITPERMGHTAWRRFAEFWTHADIIHDIKGEPLEDGGAGGEKPPFPPGRLGNPRGNVYQIVDDSGGWLLLGTSLFWGAFGEIYEPDRIDAHFDWFRRWNIHDARVISCGIRRGTLERSLDPTQESYQRGVAGITDRAIRFGRRIDWDIFGATYPAPTKERRRQTVRDFCDALRGRTHGVTGISIVNEGWKNGFEGDAGRNELKELVALVHELLPEVLVSSTCPNAGDDISDAERQYYNLGFATSWMSEHYARSIAPPDGKWRPTKKAWCEQNFSSSGCPLLRRNREPRGNNSSGSWTDDPLILALDMAVTYVSGVCGYTWHNAAGIYGVAYDTPYGFRHANSWESVNAEAIAQAFQHVLKVLPADLPNWNKHPTNKGPFRFVDTPDEQLSAAYSATAGEGVGQRIVQPVWGVVKATEFALQSGRCDGQVLDPVSGHLTPFDRAFVVTPQQRAVLAVATRTA